MGLGAATDALGLSTPAPQIYEQLPRAVKSFQNKYTFSGPYAPLANIVPQLPDDVRANLIRADQQRVVRGDNPVGPDDTIAALQTVLTGKQFTPAPKARNPITDLPNAIFRDVRDIARSIPKMPVQLIQETAEIPKIPQRIAEAQAKGENIVEALAHAPGLRMIPGAFTVGNLAGGHYDQLLRHPVITALDVAPAAGKAVGALAELPGVESKIAALKDSEAFRTINASRPVLKAREAFGADARNATYMLRTAESRLGDWADPAREISPALEVDNPNAAKEQAFAKAARGLPAKYGDLISSERDAVLKQAIETDTLDQVNPTDVERAYVGEYKDIRQQIEDYALTRQDVPEAVRSVLNPATGKTNIFPAKQASRIEAGRNLAQYHGDFASLRAAAMNAEGTTVDSVLSTLQPYLGTDVVGDVARRRAILDAGAKTLRALDQRKIATVIDDAATDLFQRKNPEAAQAKFDSLNMSQNADPVTAISRETILRKLRGLDDSRLDKIRTLVEGRAWKPARASAQGLLNAGRGLTEDVTTALSSVVDDLSTARKTEQFLDRTSNYTDKRAATLTKAAERRFQRTVPAKYMPLIEQGTKERLAQAISTGEIQRGKNLAELPPLPDEARTKLLTDVVERNFTNLDTAGIDPMDIRRIQRQVASTWTEMEAAGLDPTLVHRVTPSSAPSVNFPTVKAQITSPSQVKARTFDATPHYDNLSVALNHQALEWLSRRAVTEFVDQVVDKWAIPHDELYNRYVPFARQRHSLNPSLDINAHVGELMKREWAPWNPNERFPWMGKRVTGMSKGVEAGGSGLAGKVQGEMWVPRTVSNTIDRLFNDQPGLISQLTAPFMNGFRTSVLSLSPRWHAYNILGGAVMMMARTDPLTVWKYLGDAIKANKEGTLPDAFRGELGKAQLTQMDLGLKGGIKMGEWWKQAQERIPGAEAAASGFRKVTDASWKFNQFVDDMYRTMSYMYGYDKELTRGLSKEQAIAAGVELSRKIMPDWNSMTPIERNVIRSVVPFYGFMSHVLRYVYKYPFDHPVRAAVLGNFANAEMNDMAEATPTKFSDIMAFGGTDDKGNRKAFSTSGLNPFSSVADTFTMTGFLSQVNPLIATALEQVGVKRGKMDLNPDVRYDPDTGRLALQTPNPIANLIAHTLPQVSLFMNLANPTSDLNRIRATNPDTSEAIIRGALGIPRLVIPFNEQSEQMKAELSRRDAQNKIKAAALKSGIDTQAQNSPQLATFLNQLRALQSSNPDVFTKYAPGTYSAALGIAPTPGTTAIAKAQRILLGSLTG